MQKIDFKQFEKYLKGKSVVNILCLNKLQKPDAQWVESDFICQFNFRA